MVLAEVAAELISNCGHHSDAVNMAEFPDAAKYTKVIAKVTWHRFEAHHWTSSEGSR